MGRYRALYIILIITLTCSFTNKVEENYPTPNTKELIFYIQRNLNSNTIIYDANFDKNGNINAENPIDVYWIRYDEQGQRMELRSIEKALAFGIEHSKHEIYENQFKVVIVAEKNRELILKQTAPFEAKAYININNKMSELSYLYLDAIDGIIPRLQSIEYYGIDTITKKSTYEKVHYNL